MFLGGQVEVAQAPGNYLTSAGFTSKISDDKAISTQVSTGKEGNSVSFSLQRDIDKDISRYITQSFSSSATDGNSSITSFGTNTKIDENAKMRAEHQFITSDQRGAYTSNLMAFGYEPTKELGFDISYQKREEDFNSNLIGPTPKHTFSGNISYAKPDFLKCYSKSEYRKDHDMTWQVLTDNQAELKFSQDFFLFGEYEYSIGDKKEQNSYARIDKKQAGVAYRPVEFDWFNLLFKYTRLTDERPQDLINPDGDYTRMDSTMDVLAGECALDLPFNFQFVEKVAYKEEATVSHNALGTIKTPEELEALLMVHRINYHLTKKIDVATEYRRLAQQGSNIHENEGGFLFEISYQVVNNISLGMGFNCTSFTDDLTIKTKKSTEGFFFRVQGKY